MKAADRDHCWRHVGPKWPTDGRQPILSRLEVGALEGFRSGDAVELSGGLTVLCGANGAGKTRLLRAIADRLRGAAADVEVSAMGVNDRVDVIDVSWQVQRQRSSLTPDSDLEDRLASAGGFTDLRATERDLVSYFARPHFHTRCIR